MKVPTPAYRCALARLQPDPRPDPEQIKREGLARPADLVISPTTRDSTGSNANCCAGSAIGCAGSKERQHGWWTIETVADRFIEAARTAHRLPPVRVQGYFNCWPAIKRMPWENLGA